MRKYFVITFLIMFFVIFVPKWQVKAASVQTMLIEKTELFETVKQDPEYEKYCGGNNYILEYENVDSSEPELVYSFTKASRSEIIIQGCDVSKWQGAINWHTAKRNGIEFVFVRVGFRGRTDGQIYEDEYWEANVSGAIAAGIRVGVYFFSEAINEQEAVEEAKWLYGKTKAYNLTMPCVIDYEGFDNTHRVGAASLSKETMTNIVLAFCDQMYRYTRVPCVYSSASHFVDYLNGTKIAEKYQLWQAAYSAMPDAYNSDPYDCWQFSSKGNGTYFGMSSTYLDMDYWYPGTGLLAFSDGIFYYDAEASGVDWNYNGLEPYVNKWYMVVNGRVDTTYNGLVKNEYGWWYVRNGAVDFSYTGLCKNSNGVWYVKNGQIKFDMTGLAKVSNTCINHADGKSYTYNGSYYVEKGQVNFNYTGLCKNADGVWYVKDSKVQFGITDVLQVSNTCINDADGKSYTYNGWYYVKEGKLVQGSPTVAHNTSGWWYIDKNGKVDFTANTIAQNENGWWYIKDGKVDFTYKGLAQNPNGWWYLENGKVIFSFSGLVQNAYGWWYVENGGVNFNYNGLCDNKYGTWLVQKGKVQFGITDVIQVSNTCINDADGKSYTYNGWYYVKEGKLVKNSPTVAQNKNGWWYIDGNGKVDFGFTGLASNSNGLWYLEKGKVNFDYNNSDYWYQGKHYVIQKGKATLKK